eukprot:281501-Chlamydomonas_euryale.AAC.2
MGLAALQPRSKFEAHSVGATVSKKQARKLHQVQKHACVNLLTHSRATPPDMAQGSAPRRPSAGPKARLSEPCARGPRRR